MRFTQRNRITGRQLWLTSRRNLEAREPDRPPRRAKAHATSKLRGTHQLHLCRAPALIVPRTLRSATAALRASSRRHRRVYARLRRATSAFTRVFDALWRRGALHPGASVPLALRWVPDAVHREVRCTASGTRAEFALRGRVVICPSGGLWTGVSSPLCKNISVFVPPKSLLEPWASHPTRGALAIVTNAGRDAVDAAASGAQRDAGLVERLVSDQTAS